MQLCSSCHTDQPAIHTVIIGDGADGPRQVCTWCAVSFVFRAANRGLIHVTLAITPAPRPALAGAVT